jgi:uncharacterized cupin superfamily protein
VTPKIEIDQAPIATGSRYPAPYDAPCRERVRRRLGDALGLTQFGVNLTRLPPGCWSSQRHWHQLEDELIYVLEGELMLVTEAGEQLLRAGDCAAFKAGVADGHHLQNRSQRDAVVLEIGTRSSGDLESVEYPDIDLRVQSGRYVHRDGTPYDGSAPRRPKSAP